MIQATGTSILAHQKKAKIVGGPKLNEKTTNTKFDESLTEAQKRYFEKGARSNDKLKKIHGRFIENLKSLGLDAHGLNDGTDSKEIKVQGLFIWKNCDITILRGENKSSTVIPEGDKKPIVISVKSPMTNFSQNANNYFELMIGETVNLKLNNVKVYQVLILPYETPYLDKGGIVKKVETLQNHHIDKYQKLSKTFGPHAPDGMLIRTLNLWTGLQVGQKLTKANININNNKNNHLTNYNKDNQAFLKSVNNYHAFIEKIKNDN